jgi:hypothetical protein
MINNTIHVDDETRFAFDLFDELFHKFFLLDKYIKSNQAYTSLKTPLSFSPQGEIPGVNPFPCGGRLGWGLLKIKYI